MKKMRNAMGEISWYDEQELDNAGPDDLVNKYKLCKDTELKSNLFEVA